jgi:hypothetical protein
MAQFGGRLPVYAGTRYQRGGGILSSIARFAMPIVKRLFGRAAATVPSVVGSIMTKSSTPKQALLKGLKTIGMNTAVDEFENLIPSKTRGQKRPARKRKFQGKRGYASSQKGGRAKKRKRSSSSKGKTKKKCTFKRDSLA